MAAGTQTTDAANVGQVVFVAQSVSNVSGSLG
ncbi:MAG: hypothetical protein RLZZ210_646, partial [Pseudomonadota bacterium]